MTAYNIVRFRVKPGCDSEFIAAHEAADPGFSGLRRFSMVDTGGSTYCIIGEWDSFDDIVAARTGMMSLLDTFRHLLEDMGGGLGVTDPVSGSAVLEMGAQAKRAARKKPAGRKPLKAKAPRKGSAKTKGRKPARKAVAKSRAGRAKRR